MREYKARAFSLLEALVALAFLALAALAVVSAFVFAGRLKAQQNDHHEAALIAFDAMEEARGLLAQSFLSDVTLAATADPNLPRFQVERRQSFVSEDEGVLKDSLKQVEVVVTWQEQGKDKSFRLLERFCRP